jgi:hypothetical protein
MAKKNTIELTKIKALQPKLKAIEECGMMLHYAQSKGKLIPPHIIEQLGKIQAAVYTMEMELDKGAEKINPLSINYSELSGIHHELAKVIAPASPATVFLMEKHKKKGISGLLGPVPLVRQLNLLTLLCLITFLSLFYINGVNGVDSFSVNGDILSYKGMRFIFNELVIVCIAALGSCFYALFEVSKYIAKNSYDPKYDSVYWIRISLGIVSGVILAQFIFVSPEIINPENSRETANELGAFITYKPLLAFLGGFSARVVHKILNSLVEAIETFISGSARDMVRTREEAAKVKMMDNITAIKQKNAQDDAAERMKSTLKLMQLKQDLMNGADSKDMDARLTLLMNELMSPVGVDVNFGKNNTTLTFNNEKMKDTYYDSQEVKTSEDLKNKPEMDYQEFDIPDFPDEIIKESPEDRTDTNLKI